jgi:hypothetical protein
MHKKENPDVAKNEGLNQTPQTLSQIKINYI